jgi:hypothetical protein
VATKPSLLREEFDLTSFIPVFDQGDPFRNIVIDNFLRDDVAKAVAEEFPEFNGREWAAVYDNPIEVKKALNHWDRFPKNTYALFNFLNSDEFVAQMSELAGVKVWADPGLHGGGWHTHAAGGKLNTHLDYSIHPKLGLERILNLIIYMTPDWREDYGGALGFWVEDNGKPRRVAETDSVPVQSRGYLRHIATIVAWLARTRDMSAPYRQEQPRRVLPVRATQQCGRPWTCVVCSAW